MEYEEYLELDRTVYRNDKKSGIRVSVSPDEYDMYGEQFELVCLVLDAVIAGDAEAYNDFMGSKSLTGGIALALDRARISPMNPDSAVAFLDEVKNESKHKETAKAWADRYASPLEAAKSGHIDDIIDSAELRQRICAALGMLFSKTDVAPTRRHANMPL